LPDLGDVKKDFEIFGKGIQRLEEIKGELKSLNTKSYKKEVEEIESNLKKVSAIPKIEKQLENLKKKIQGKNRKPAKRKVNRTQNISESSIYFFFQLCFDFMVIFFRK